MQRHQIDQHRLARDIPFSLTRLKDPRTLIDWRCYSQVHANLSKYLSYEQLLSAGEFSLNYGDLHQLLSISKLYGMDPDSDRRTLHHEIFQRLFGADGWLSQTFPCESRLVFVSDGHFRLTLGMHQTPCRIFESLVAGQIIGVPAFLGGKPARVDVTRDQGTVTYDISCQPPGESLASRFTRFLIQHSGLLETYRELAQTRRELFEMKQIMTESADRNPRQESQSSRPTARIESTVLPIWRLDHLRQLTSENDAARQPGVDGLSADRHMVSLLASLDPTDLPVSLSAAIRPEAALDIKAPISPTWLELHLMPALDDRRAVIVIGKEITAVRNVFLEQQDQRQRDEFAQDAHIRINAVAEIIQANPASATIFGYSATELIGLPLIRLIPDLGTLSKPSMSRPSHQVQACEGRKSDGSLIALNALHTGNSWIFRDLSHHQIALRQQDALREQLLASQKMEAIGQLAGGVAHDFNNLLVAINGYADLAGNPDVSDDLRRTYLDEISQAGNRAGELTRKLLAFGGRQVMQPGLAELNPLIQNTARLLDRLLPENIHFRFKPGLDELNVMVDSGQIEQAIINLVVNARDAMPRGGRITITTASRYLARGSEQPRFAAGHYAILNVSDDGIGMSDEVRQHLFEPFFTTKAEGQGTGLGMSVVHGIIEQHQGHIELKSKPGQGSDVTIYLPLANARPVARTQKASQKISGGSETILLVEDSLQVRDLARLMLTSIGYRVLEADNGSSALEIFRQHHASIDLVLMDVVMPELGGRDTLTQMRAIKADVRALFTSGYSSSAMHTKFIVDDGLNFIPKPYSPNELRIKVRKVLDQHTQITTDKPHGVNHADRP
jgi:signal transduction histidine kinase/ActR/RegA family two-component response regulator